MNKLEIKNLQKNFNTIDGEIEVIKNISFNLKDQEFISLIGKSGCGKSTILNIISGLEKPTQGEIKTTNKIGYMMQNDALLEYYTILDNVLLGLKLQNKLTEENINYAHFLLKKYHLDKFTYKHPSELSGGMRQRVALIRTLILKPELILLDEPFSALDYSTRLTICDDVYQILKENNIAAIIITHDIGEAISTSDKVIVLTSSPATIKNTYNIEISSTKPSQKRKDSKYNYYFDKIWNDLNDV